MEVAQLTNRPLSSTSSAATADLPHLPFALDRAPAPQLGSRPGSTSHLLLPLERPLGVRLRPPSPPKHRGGQQDPSSPSRVQPPNTPPGMPTSPPDSPPRQHFSFNSLGAAQLPPMPLERNFGQQCTRQRPPSPPSRFNRPTSASCRKTPSASGLSYVDRTNAAPQHPPMGGSHSRPSSASRPTSRPSSASSISRRQGASASTSNLRPAQITPLLHLPLGTSASASRLPPPSPDPHQLERPRAADIVPLGSFPPGRSSGPLSPQKHDRHYDSGVVIPPTPPGRLERNSMAPRPEHMPPKAHVFLPPSATGAPATEHELPELEDVPTPTAAPFARARVVA